MQLIVSLALEKNKAKTYIDIEYFTSTFVEAKFLNRITMSLNSEEKFVLFEKKQRDIYQVSSRSDREHETDQNGFYSGYYGPEKTYVMAMCAFLDEYGLEMSIPDISGLTGDRFIREFDRFQNKMTYTTIRYNLRKDRVGDRAEGTLISFSATYKSKIGDLLGTIRKIVNQEILDDKKKDKIFSKVASLQSEVDRDRTTIDAVFGRAIDLSRTIGECGKNIEPLIDKMERLKKIFWDKSSRLDRLDQEERPKLTDASESKSIDLSNEIPF